MSSGEYSGSMNLPPWLRTKDKLPAFYVFTHLVKGARGGGSKVKAYGAVPANPLASRGEFILTFPGEAKASPTP